MRIDLTDTQLMGIVEQYKGSIKSFRNYIADHPNQAHLWTWAVNAPDELFIGIALVAGVTDRKAFGPAMWDYGERLRAAAQRSKNPPPDMGLDENDA